MKTYNNMNYNSNNKIKDDSFHRGIEVIIQNLKTHPVCPHGPTLLFSKRQGEEKRNFFACSACRSRKDCQFFLWEDELNKFTKSKKEIWNLEQNKFLNGVNHRKMFLQLNQVKGQPKDKRIYCQNCLRFVEEEFLIKHKNHNIIKDISDYQLEHPTEILPPLDDSKKEAQYLFSRKSVVDLVDILKDLGILNVICIGTPRIHEFIRSECSEINSILLDFDKRFHNFFGPLEYGWYNFFNHHFFFEEAQLVFEDFLKSTGGKNTIIFTDPPFGGRIEPLADSIDKINSKYNQLTGTQDKLPIFWIFPYFMEAQMINFLPKFCMLDYKVEYDNHPLFQNGSKGRKQGSPVRVFTNVSSSLIKLPDIEYKHCRKCKKWVSLENRHCKSCDSCTSKNGETYVHCRICKKCVKPNWQHCTVCQRCTQVGHKCGTVLTFQGKCLNCKETGHKKADCTKLETQNKSIKRKKGLVIKQLKKKKIDSR